MTKAADSEDAGLRGQEEIPCESCSHAREQLELLYLSLLVVGHITLSSIGPGID